MGQKIQTSLKLMAKCEEGATAIIYALCLLPMMLVLGFAIDFSRIASAENHVQYAVDNAVLASALDFSKNKSLPEAQRLESAIDTFNATYAADITTSNVNLSTISIEVSQNGENGIQADVVGRLPLAFGGFFGRENIELPASSQAEIVPPQAIELVLALDNTGSMFNNNRFNLMRSAAKDFTNNVFDSSAGPGATSIGVVPWATLVNINSERPGNFDVSPAADRNPTAAGTRNVPNAPFQDRLRHLLEPEAEVNYTREALERDFAPVAWRGCIRSAPDERRVSSGGNISRALTDDPVQGMRWHVSLVEPELQSVPLPNGAQNGEQPINASIQLAPNRILRCTQRRIGPGQSGRRNVYVDVDRACRVNNSNSIDLAEACVSDPNEFDFFREGGKACPWLRESMIFPWSSVQQQIAGPNQNCPVSMLGLSEDRSQVIDKLDEMYPVTGGTHMDLGLMWGLRVLSPRREWASFFGQGRPSEYDDTETRKILVLLTDGQNIPPRDFEGYYGCTEGNSRGEAGECWDAPSVRRLDGNVLNGLTADACVAIRETYGIEVFTIAVDINNQNLINLLADCAGNEERAFNIRASEIDAVFESIAARELRITN